jgi:hypothetical protein
VTPTARHRSVRDDDTGSVLVISLVIVTVVALVVGGLLSYADANVKATVALRSQATAAATADGAAQVALNTLKGNLYNNSPSTKCFDSGTTTSDVLAQSNLIPGSTGAAANSAAVQCSPDPSTGAAGASVPITASNKPGNAILTLSTNAAEDGLYVKALNNSLPFSVRGGIISNSNIRVANGTLKSTVDVQARGACIGTIVSTPPAACNRPSVPGDPNYAPETTTVPPYRPVPANAAASCPGKVFTFQPGYYDDADALSGLMDGNGPCKNSVWWFKPGNYYFDFQNTGSHEWLLKNGQLIAGTPVNSSGTPIAAPASPVSVPGACDSPIHSTTAVGVQFMFGADSRLRVSGSADAEICGSYHADRPPLAVYGVKTGAGGPTTANNGVPTNVNVVSGFTPTATSGSTTPAGAVAAAGDGKTLSWTGTGTTATVNLTAFSPTVSLPAGTTLTSAKVRFVYGTSAAVTSRKVVVTPTPGTAVTKNLSATAQTVGSTQTVDLTTDLAAAVKTSGLTGLHLGYTSTRTGTAAEVLDAVLLDLTYTAPALRAQNGCITQAYSTSTSGCAVISTPESFSGAFYIQGTTYTPLAAIDISLSNITAQVLRFGVVSRVLQVKETGSLSYDGPVIEIPDDSPGYGPGGTVVLLQVYVCEATSTCSPSSGQLRLRVRAYIKDPGALGPLDGRSLIVQSWATQR